MTWLLRVFVFMLVFTLDVRVKAESAALPNAGEVFQEPQGCLMRASVCAVKTGTGEKYKLQVGKAVVTLDSKTAVVRATDAEITLISGTVWVQSESAFTVKTEFGAARALSGEFWVSRDKNKMWASATGNALILEPRGSTQALRLETGEENWLGGVGRDGEATSGVPRAIALADHLRRWARLFPGTKKEFETEAHRFYGRWSRQVASVAEYHRDLAERRRLALQDAEDRRARQRAQAAKEAQEIRSLYRRKVLFE